MTMLVDRRKDNYDELLMVAGDSRASRARTNRWTTGLIVGAMAATGAYVATVSQQVDSLRETAEEAQQQRDTAELAYKRLLEERTVLQAELNSLLRYQDLNADSAAARNLSSSITRLAERMGSGTGSTTPVAGTTSVTHFATSNLVWMVDGSRRFPMINGDILWVPEGNFWVRLEGTSVADYRLYRTATNRSGEAGQDLTNEQRRGNLMTLPYRETVVRGSLDCVQIELHSESLRPVFRDQGYVDIEVTYFKSDRTNRCN